MPSNSASLPRAEIASPKTDAIHGMTREIERLSAAAMKFSLQLDHKRLFQDIAVEAATMLTAEQVLAYSMTDGRLRLESWYPLSEAEWPPVDGLSGDAQRAIRHHEPVLSKLDQTGSSTLRNSIFVPLVGTQNRLMGLVEIRNKRHGAFYLQRDLQLAICLGRIATSAVDRARLFERIEEWSQSIKTLLSFNAAVNQHLPPQELVRQLVCNAIGFIDADGGAAGIAVQNESVPAIECDGFYFDQKWHPFIRCWQSNDGVPGTVLHTEFPLLINDYATHPLADRELRTKFDIGSCICVPIKNASEQILGFFKLHRRMGKPGFTWQDAAVLESLGNTAAVAIENARLVKSLERKNDQVKNLSAAHVRSLEQERQHIARELHDETGQVLIGLKLRLQLLSRKLTPEQTDAKQEFDSMQQQLSDAALRLRDLAKRLRPSTLDELGFEATLRQLLSDYRRQVDLEIVLEVSSQPRNWTNEAETALYRIVQECLTNVAKHAEAKTVFIRIYDWEGLPAIAFEDDGRGFDIEASTNGLGLIGIRERVKMLGAQIAIHTGKGKGTKIEITRIPVE